MQLNPNVTHSDISEVTGFSESKTYRVIQALRAKDIVVRVGARKNGTWKVVVAIDIHKNPVAKVCEYGKPPSKRVKDSLAGSIAKRSTLVGDTGAYVNLRLGNMTYSQAINHRFPRESTSVKGWWHCLGCGVASSLSRFIYQRKR